MHASAVTGYGESIYIPMIFVDTYIIMYQSPKALDISFIEFFFSLHAYVSKHRNIVGKKCEAFVNDDD